EWMTWRYGMHYDLAAAEFSIARGDLDRARQHIHNCLAVAQRTRSRRYLVRANRLLAACPTAAGDPAERERLLATVVTQARDLANPSQTCRALLAWATAQRALGRRDQAVLSAREGVEVADRVITALPSELHSTFRQSALYVGLQELSQ